jgi:hypothetical protein
MMNMNSFLFSAKVVPSVDSRVNRILKALCFFYLSDIVSSQTGALARAYRQVGQVGGYPSVQTGMRPQLAVPGPAFRSLVAAEPLLRVAGWSERQPAIRLAA